MREQGRWTAVGVLTGLNLLNYLDRFLLPAVTESIRRELSLEDWQSGLLASAFLGVFIVASPLFGWLGDRRARTRMGPRVQGGAARGVYPLRRTDLIALGALIWSLATACTGLAGGFLALFATRMVVGIGEAAYGTIAPALLADAFGKEARGRVFALFYAAIPVGSALGYLAGGYLNHRWGWRAAFGLAGLPGLLLAFLAWRLAEPERTAEREESTWRVYASLLKNRPYLATVLGYTGGTFGIGALSFWMPTFLSRERGYSVTEAPMVFGALIAAAGLMGSLGGGWVADWLAARGKRPADAYLWLSGVSSLIAVPFALVALLAPQRWLFLPAILVAGTLLFASTGPINALLVTLVPARTRATAVALATVSIHLLGDAASPTLVGLLSTSTGDLGVALLLAPAAVTVGGALWLYQAWRGVAVPTERNPSVQAPLRPHQA